MILLFKCFCRGGLTGLRLVDSAETLSFALHNLWYFCLPSLIPLSHFILLFAAIFVLLFSSSQNFASCTPYRLRNLCPQLTSRLEDIWNSFPAFSSHTVRHFFTQNLSCLHALSFSCLFLAVSSFKRLQRCVKIDFSTTQSLYFFTLSQQQQKTEPEENKKRFTSPQTTFVSVNHFLFAFIK